MPVAASYGEMITKTVAMHKANSVEWDIISPQIFELENLSEYLLDLGDCSALPRVANEAVPGSCVRYRVHYLTGGDVLAYNVDAVRDRKPQSWADFWDVKRFPGRRALPSYGNPWNNSLALALLADGVASLRRRVRCIPRSSTARCAASPRPPEPSCAAGRASRRSSTPAANIASRPRAA